MNLVKLRCESCGELCNFDADSGKKGVICRSCGSKVYFKPENIVQDEPQMNEMPPMDNMQMQQGYPEAPEPMPAQMQQPMGQPMQNMGGYPDQNMGGFPQQQEEYPQMPPTVQPRKGKKGKQQLMRGQEMPQMQEQALQRNKRAKLEAQAPANLQPKQKSGGSSPIVLIACILAIVCSIFSALTATKTNKAVNEMKDMIEVKLDNIQSQPAAPVANDASQVAPAAQTTDTWSNEASTSDFGNSDQFGTPAQPVVENNTADPNTTPNDEFPALQEGTVETPAPAEAAPTEGEPAPTEGEPAPTEGEPAPEGETSEEEPKG